MAGAARAAPPRYVAAAADLRREFGTIRTRMAELRALHGRAALTTFDDGDGRDAEVEAATREVTAALRAAEARVAALAARSPAGGGGGPSNDADDRVRANVRRTLAGELQALSLAFRGEQKAYLSKLQRAGRGGGLPPSATPAWDALLDGAGRSPSVDYSPADTPTGFDAQQTARADALARAAADRDRDVAAVVTSIADLAQIVKDLGVLVVEQGTVLDRIDYNIETVAVRVDDGARQLARAERSQRAGRLALCIMLLAAAVVLMLLIIVLRAVF